MPAILFAALRCGARPGYTQCTPTYTYRRCGKPRGSNGFTRSNAHAWATVHLSTAKPPLGVGVAYGWVPVGVGHGECAMPWGTWHVRR